MSQTNDVIDSKTDSPSKRRYTIHRLVMINPNICMLCNKLDSTKDCRMLALGDMWGWMYCTECASSGALRKEVLGYLRSERSIPCAWLRYSNTFISPPYMGGEATATTVRPRVSNNDSHSYEATNMNHLNFFRYSKRGTKMPVHSGTLSNYSYISNQICYDKQRGLFCVPLNFVDTETGADLLRTVELTNIFAHTPGFYEALIKTDDLLVHAHAKISFADLGEEIAKNVHDLYEQSLVRDKTSYQY